jgi:hypothetical protein
MTLPNPPLQRTWSSLTLGATPLNGSIVGQTGDVVKEILKRVAPILRALGFRGSGQNYRKTEGDFVFVVNFQGSRWGDNFYVNLGAQPAFIPAEGDADLDKLKEYECILRRRVGKEWPWELSDRLFASLHEELSSAQAEFFGRAQTLRSALAIDSPDELLRKFSAGTTEARATLHLARAATKLGHIETARKLVDRGLELAGDGATILRAELQRVLEQTVAGAPQPAVAADGASPRR